MNAFVESPLGALFGCLVFLLVGCDGPVSERNEEPASSSYEIVGISEVRLKDVGGYPSAYGVILVKSGTGNDPFAVAIPAFREGKLLDSYLTLEIGERIQLNPLPWAVRPPVLNASYLANGFADEIDLLIFFDRL